MLPNVWRAGGNGFFLSAAFNKEPGKSEKEARLQTPLQQPAVSESVTSKQVSITLQDRGAGPGGGSP